MVRNFQRRDREESPTATEESKLYHPFKAIKGNQRQDGRREKGSLPTREEGTVREEGGE